MDRWEGGVEPRKEVAFVNQNNPMDSDFVLRMDHEVAAHGRWVVVNWCITSRCNFWCRYCVPGLHDGGVPALSPEACCWFVDRVMDHYGRTLGRKVYFEFTGGEATFYPGLLEVLRHIKLRGGACGLISNGSQSLEYWRGLAPLLDHLCLSYHPWRGDPEDFLEKADFLHRETSVHFNVMMDPRHFQPALEMVAALRASVTNATICAQPLLESLNPGSPLLAYDEDQLTAIDGLDGTVAWDREPFTYRGGMRLVRRSGESELLQASQIALRQLNRWHGWTCWAGLESLAVQVNGEVFRAWCRQDYLGRIQDPDWSFPRLPAVCKRESCHCNADIVTRREL